MTCHPVNILRFLKQFQVSNYIVHIGCHLQQKYIAMAQLNRLICTKMFIIHQKKATLRSGFLLYFAGVLC